MATKTYKNEGDTSSPIKVSTGAQDSIEPNYTKEIFNGFANNYDTLSRIISFNSLSRLRRKFTAKIDLREDEKILDLGTGTGKMMKKLEDMQKRLSHVSSKVIGTDISDKMLEVAAKRVAGKLILADSADLPFADGSFDKVVATFAYRVLPDRQTTLSEVARVLQPGGSFYSLEYRYSDDRIAGTIARSYINLLKLILKFSPMDRDMRYLANSFANYPEHIETVEFAKIAGFSNVRFTYMMRGSVEVIQMIK